MPHFLNEKFNARGGDPGRECAWTEVTRRPSATATVEHVGLCRAVYVNSACRQVTFLNHSGAFGLCSLSGTFLRTKLPGDEHTGDPPSLPPPRHPGRMASSRTESEALTSLLATLHRSPRHTKVIVIHPRWRHQPCGLSPCPNTCGGWH